jgi:hypothetical protein
LRGRDRLSNRGRGRLSNTREEGRAEIGERGDRAGSSGGSSLDIIRMQQQEQSGSSSVTRGDVIQDQAITRSLDRTQNRQDEPNRRQAPEERPGWLIISETPAWQSSSFQASLRRLKQERPRSEEWVRQLLLLQTAFYFEMTRNGVPAEEVGAYAPAFVDMALRDARRQDERSVLLTRILESPAWQSRDVQTPLTRLRQEPPGENGWINQAANVLFKYRDQMRANEVSEEEFDANTIEVYSILRPGGSIYLERQTEITRQERQVEQQQGQNHNSDGTENILRDQLVEFATETLMDDPGKEIPVESPNNSQKNEIVWAIVGGLGNSLPRYDYLQEEEYRAEYEELMKRTFNGFDEWREKKDQSRTNAD